MSIKLYPYQEKAVAEIYAKWSSDRRLILWAMTGAGKSEMASYIAQDASKDGVPVVMIVRGRPLVNNLSKRLDKYKINHSVFMAGHHRLDKTKLIQVCSSDTMISREQYPFSDRDCIVILDEQHKSYEDILSHYPFQYILGMTATPFGQENHLYHDYVLPIESVELRDNGVLVPEEIYSHI